MDSHGLRYGVGLALAVLIVTPLPVQAQGLAWLQALNADASIESATQQVLASHPTWRPDTIVHLCLSHGLLCPLQHPESPR